jgi:hypothetical protein
VSFTKLGVVLQWKEINRKQICMHCKWNKNKVDVIPRLLNCYNLVDAWLGIKTSEVSFTVYLKQGWLRLVSMTGLRCVLFNVINGFLSHCQIFVEV